MSKPVSAGTRVFFRHPDRSWEKGNVVEHEETARGLRYTCKDDNGDTSENLHSYDVHKMTDGIDAVKPDDLLQLSELHVAVLLSVLKNRFQEDNIYTHIGNLIIAVNPFKWTIPWYLPENGLKYIEEGWGGSPLNRTNLRPHSWAVANKSYWDMVAAGNQSILISGESGAGKTEGAKIILRYFGDLCTALLQKEGASEADIKKVTEINTQLQQASPILESFGNAKTTRNDNSSRFGKFMKIQFNTKGILVGMHNTPYLLEKSRVVKCGQEERLYHSFYQLVLGASPEQRQRYQLGEAKSYKALKMGGCLTIPRVDDAEDFATVLEAMRIVGFTESDIDSAWAVVAACLHMSQLEFSNNEKGNAVVTEGQECIGKAAAMLRISGESLERSLLSMTRKMGREVVQRPMNMMQASDTRHSLCIFLYESLFLWMVEKINLVVARPEEEAKWIGLLDIFGFENFKVNSFEQLCINLANERLQKHYNTYVYDKDRQECADEGIHNAHAGVAVNDNQPCLDLIMGGKGSIYSLLDDVCKATQSGDAKDDRKFLDSMIERFGGEGNKEKGVKRNDEGQVIVKREKPDDFFEYDPRNPEKFSIHHYAGTVKYDVQSFVNKNIDLLSEEIKSLCRTTEDELVAQLIPPAPAPNDKTRRVTVSGTFKQSLVELIDTIQSTKPNWVRCIRPNPQKVPDKFHAPSVLDQLTCSGVVETVKTRQQGFCYRLPFEEFFSRYSVLGDKSRSGGKDKCQSVLTALKVDKKEAQVGRTKVFLRVKAFQLVEEAREDALRDHVLNIQRFAQWRRSSVLVLDRKWAVMGRRVQKWMKLCIRRDAIIIEHYKHECAEIIKVQGKERKNFVAKELDDRQKCTTEEKTERRDLHIWHRGEMKGLWGNVLLLAQRNETTQREQQEAEEHLVFRGFPDLQKQDWNAAKEKERERRKREKIERKLQRLVVENREFDARKEIETEEDEARANIRRVWEPVRDKLMGLAARIKRLNVRREKKLRQYRLQRDQEVRRQQSDTRAAIREESALWSSFVSSSSASALYSSGMSLGEACAPREHHPPPPVTGSVLHDHLAGLHPPVLHNMDPDDSEESDIHREVGRLAGWDAALAAASTGYHAEAAGFPEPMPPSLAPWLGAEAGGEDTAGFGGEQRMASTSPTQSVADYYRQLFNIPVAQQQGRAVSGMSSHPEPAAATLAGGGVGVGGGGGGGGGEWDFLRRAPSRPRFAPPTEPSPVPVRPDPVFADRVLPAATPPVPRAEPSLPLPQPLGQRVGSLQHSARHDSSHSVQHMQASQQMQQPQQHQSFFSEGQAAPLASLGQLRKQEERFYRACVPSTLITQSDPALAAVESYSEYTAYWRETYDASLRARQQDEHMRDMMKRHDKALKKRNMVERRVV